MSYVKELLSFSESLSAWAVKAVGRMSDPITRTPAARGWHAIALGWLVAFILLSAVRAFGASPIDGFDFPDAETAERYQALLSEFRCPKCLNESIASSGAPIAVDLRRTVRRLMTAGAGDDEIRAHLRARYGDFVLYDPPLGPGTWALWFAPLALAGVGVAVLVRAGLRRRAASLTEQERERVARLLDEAP